MMQERTSVVGVFDDRQDAEDALHDLEMADFSENEIGYVIRGENEDKNGTTGSALGGGAIAGGLTGGIVGAAVSLLVPGLGPVIAGGILATSRAGAAAGAASGALIGPLVEAGVARDDAERYERDFEAGKAIIGVTALHRSAEAEEILRRHGASLEPTATDKAARPPGNEGRRGVA